MLLGFYEPQATDFQYLATPKSAQAVGWSINRIAWNAGDGTGMFETSNVSTGWRANTAGYGLVSLMFPVLVGSGVNGSGQTTSPLDPSGAANPTLMTLADVAAGVWDALLTQGLQNVATYLPNAALRLTNEWYGTWYPWNGPALGAAGKAAYQHVVTLARSVNPSFKFEWNGCLDLSFSAGYSFADVQNFYPGDPFVDYLSADIYDSTTGTVGQAMWDYRVGQMSQCLPFAQAHGKPYCITEWGLYNIAQSGIGNDDDWQYIVAAHNWMRANAGALGWTMFYNPANHDGRLQNNPQSEATFKALFTAWAQEMAGHGRPRFVTPGFGQIGGISPAGAFAHARGAGLKTLAVNPSAVGNVLVLSILNTGFTGTVSSVSGGGVTTWNKIVSTNPGSAEGDTELWYGVVTTAGAATITKTDLEAGFASIGCQEFTIGTPATWAVDTSAGSSSTSAAASGNYPSVTPAGLNELYVGTALLLGGAAGGSATGFTYKSGGTTYESNSQFVYNTTASTAQSPPWTQTSGLWSAVSALLTATPVTAGAGAHRLRLK